MSFRLRTYAEQVADHLRSEILAGRWAGELPGEDRLGAELNVNHTTVGTAIRQLEKEGLLVNRGAGRPRRILMPKNAAAPSLRIAILLYEGIDRKLDYMVDLQHRLIEAGHVPTIPRKALVDLKMDVKRIAGLVEQNQGGRVGDPVRIDGSSGMVLAAWRAGIRLRRPPSGREDRGQRAGQTAGGANRGAALVRTRSPAHRHARPRGAAETEPGTNGEKLHPGTPSPSALPPVRTIFRIGTTPGTDCTAFLNRSSVILRPPR